MSYFKTVVYLVHYHRGYVTDLRLIKLLTHLPLDKMAVIWADDKFKCIFLNEYDRILILISLKFVPMSPVDNKPALL